MRPLDSVPLPRESNRLLLPADGFIYNELIWDIYGSWPREADPRADAFRFAADLTGQTPLPADVPNIRIELHNLEDVITRVGRVLDILRGRLDGIRRAEPAGEETPG